MNDLTDSQYLVLSYIVECQNEGFTPTLKEIADAMEYSSPNAAGEHVERLKRKGCVERPLNRSRRLNITEYGYRALEHYND